MKNKCELSPLIFDGHWFVYFEAGINANSLKVEGSKVVEITGTCDSDEFLDLLSNKVFESLPKDTKDLISKNNLVLIIKSLSKLD